MKRQWKEEKENLEKYILEDKLSYEEIGRRYGCTGANIKKVARKLGIDLPSKRTVNPSETFNKGTAQRSVCKNCGKEFISYKRYYSECCSHECNEKYLRKQFIQKWLSGEIDGSTVAYRPSKYIRKFLFEKYGEKCQLCGWGKVNEYTGNVPLQVHHIDGDSNNNTPENLQLLCPNCHSLTENFGGRNKKATPGRSFYYNRKRDRTK